MDQQNQTPEENIPVEPVENDTTSGQSSSAENNTASNQENQRENPPSFSSAPYNNPYGGNFYAPPTPPPQKPKKNKTLFWILLLVGLYFVLVVGLVGLIASGALKFTASSPSEENGQESHAQKEEDKKEENAPINENPSTDGEHTIVGEDYTGEKISASALYEKNVECVVFVQANYARGTSTGSGFVIDGKNGYILTNHHVVEECQDIAVTFSNGDSYTAKLVGGDSINDVAVLKIEKEGLSNVTVGNSDSLKVGDDILVIGNPLGDLTFTLTTGVVSGVNRTINTGEYNISTFQTDAAINSGNSGGPAFDATGAVVGIASAKYAATGVEGIGFCIPINDAMAIAKDLVEHGYVTGRPNFGITVSDSTGYEYTTDEWGRRVLIETMPGARIEEVGKNSCAEKAGLQAGDIVVKLGDVKITTANELINAKNKYKAGDTASIEVYRDGKTITLNVTFDEYSPE